jgi:hypothetical protein
MDETQATILGTLLEIKESVGRIDATMDSLKESSTKQEQRTNYLSSRMLAIETQHQRWKWTMAGATGVCVGLFKAIEVWWSHGGPHQ